MTSKILFGFHAVGVRLKTAPASVLEIHVDATRRDARMRQFVERAQEAGARLVDSDDARLSRLAGWTMCWTMPRPQAAARRWCWRWTA
jgi:23S rRNA (guanosine2251-2'-O)-methyltransferase